VASASRLGSRVDVGLLIACVAISLIAIALPASSTEPVSGALRRTLVAPLVALQRGAEQWRSAWAATQQRQLAVDSLAMRSVRSQGLEMENAQLRRIVGLGSRLQWGFVPAEALHSAGPIPDENLVTTITLSAGSNVGIKKYNPVIAPEGLVGVVQSADPTMSIALLYSHPDFRASAMSADGSAFGIVYPHQGGATGTDGFMLELRGVPTRVKLSEGTPIFTSGIGGVFPRGILIGTVMQEHKQPTEVWTRAYVLRPAVSPARVTATLVLTAQRVTQGTGNIWGSAVNVDSATKKMISGGDSLAKQAVVLEAAARRAALDSVRRITIDSMRRAFGLPNTVLGAPRSAPVLQDTGTARRPIAAPAAAGPSVVAPPAPVRSLPGSDSARVRRDSIRRDTIRPPHR
jgi:rod shape-determining protein MreC